VKKVSPYKKQKSWLTIGLKKSISTKNKLYVKSIKHPSMQNKLDYKEYKSKLHRLLQKSEREHYDSLFSQYKNNIRKSWDLIKNVLNKGKRPTLPEVFCIDGNDCENKSLIANKFNKFYVNIGPSLAKNIPTSKADAKT